MTNVEIWEHIVSRYNQLKNEHETTIQREWELYFQEFFDYKRVHGEIDSQRNILIGRSGRAIPDIIIKRGSDDLFAVELKQYSLFSDEMEGQLFSYLDLTHLPVGILICDKIYLYFYRYDSEEKKRIEIPFEINNPYGIKLIELLKKENFAKEKIESFVDEIIKFNKNVNEIKNDLSESNPIDIIKLFYKDYGYTSEEIECALKDFVVSITPNATQHGKITPPQPTDPTTPPPTGSGGTRDKTQYLFNGNRYGKAKLVLAVVKTYVQEHPSITYTELKHIFPDNLQGPRGVFRTPEQAARNCSDPERRYYMNAPIRLSDQSTICVCSQWAQSNIGIFLDKARSIGYEITPIFNLKMLKI